jgi:hypothetical protein
MFELFVGRDAVQRHVERPLKPDGHRPSRKKAEKHRPRPAAAVRTVSASALRSLAELVEPSPSR